MMRQTLIPLLVPGLLVLSGCGAAAGIAINTTAAGATSYITDEALNDAVDYEDRVYRMDCAGLQREYRRLDGDVLSKLNPFGNQSVNRAAVIGAADLKGCSLPER